MNIVKGMPGYLDKKKRRELVKVIVFALIIIGIMLLGYIIYKTKLNVFTIIAVLMCLPAARILVSFIIRLPYQSIELKAAKEIELKSEKLTVVYDLVLTSYEKVMPIPCLAISNGIICAYVPSEKVDALRLTSHIKEMLNQNGFSKVSVRVIKEYIPFLSRLEGLVNIAKIERLDNSEEEERIRKLLLSISL